MFVRNRYEIRKIADKFWVYDRFTVELETSHRTEFLADRYAQKLNREFHDAVLWATRVRPVKRAS